MTDNKKKFLNLLGKAISSPATPQKSGSAKRGGYSGTQTRHGGRKNDTIVTVEIKTPTKTDKQTGV